MGKYILWGLAIYGGLKVIADLSSAAKGAKLSGHVKGGGVSPLSVPRSFRYETRDSTIARWASTPKIRRPEKLTNLTSYGKRFFNVK